MVEARRGAEKKRSQKGQIFFILFTVDGFRQEVEKRILSTSSLFVRVGGGIIITGGGGIKERRVWSKKTYPFRAEGARLGESAKKLTRHYQTERTRGKDK